MSDHVPSKGEAFVKGGCGCLIVFLVLGLVATLFGGSMYIDLGGAVILFVIGGALGLSYLSIYSKGRDSR